jgi:hypothetical protein
MLITRWLDLLGRLAGHFASPEVERSLPDDPLTP